MKKIYPEKLKAGDEVRVVAPSRSNAIISEENRKITDQRFADMGLKLTFGKHIEECDDFVSSSIESRVEDMHEAFSDKNVKAVITSIGGFNSNQILKYLDWKLIKDNPKIFCGYSDITALNNAIYAKTGLVNYSGPHCSSFGQELYFDYTLEYFKKCLFSEEPFEVLSSRQWSDDLWYKDQKNRILIDNQGFSIINEGKASGTIIGANLCTFNLLQGTEYFPDMKDTILFLEDDEFSGENTDISFDRDLQSVIHLPGFKGVKGIVFGRFQKASKMPVEKLKKIVRTKKELENLPIIADADFGHTDPKITFPIGGEIKLEAMGGKAKLEIIKH